MSADHKQQGQSRKNTTTKTQDQKSNKGHK
jgi:hypothetical protein